MLRKLFAATALSLLSIPFANADNLADIYQLAVKNDPTIRAARATFQAGQEERNLGRAQLLPQIDASAGIGYSHNETRGELPISSASFPNKSDTDTVSNQWGVTLQQPVFDLPAWFQFQRGKQLTHQAAEQFAADQQDLILRVAQAYFGVLRAISNLHASTAQQTATKRQLDQAQQRFDVGLIAITDVHEAQASYDLAVANRIADQGAVGVAREKLSILTGRESANIWLLKKDYPIVDPDPTDVDAWVKFALRNNYDIKAAADARDAAHEAAKASRAGHLPKVTAQLGYQQDNTNNERKNLTTGGLSFPGSGAGNTMSHYHNDQTGASASLNLTVPLYAGGGISAASRQAYAQYNAAIERYAGAVRNTVQATRASHISVVTDVSRTRARKQAIKSSQSALDATEAGYKVGTRNIVDVLEVQQKLFGAMRDYANARYDYVINMLELKRAAGTLTPQDVYNLNQWLQPPPPATRSSAIPSAMTAPIASQTPTTPATGAPATAGSSKDHPGSS